MTHLYDHLFIAIITLFFPLYSWFETRKTERLQATPGAEPYNTIKDYKQSIVWLTGLGLVCLLNWVFQGRGAAELGLNLGSPDLLWVAGIVLALLGLGLTQMQSIQLRRNPEARAELMSQLDGFDFLLPRTVLELRWFNGLSLAAGIWEELLYRGFLIWYLQHWIGPVPALLVSSLAFGLAHSYQGAANIPRTAVIGLWLGGVFLLTGSLWPAMVAHFVFDMINGRLIHMALSE